MSSRGWQLPAAALILLVTCGAAEPPAPSWSREKRRVRPDPPPEEITRGLHYVISDEARHDLFREAITDTGGVFVGVGTNQNYLMAAWAKPDYLVVIDFDQVIIDLHQIYRALFLQVETPAEFLRLWGPKSAARQMTFNHIRTTVKGREYRQQVNDVFRQFRCRVNVGLRQALEVTKELGIPSFLDDQEQYDRIRKLFLEDRVLLTRGDFTGEKTLADLGRVLDKLGLTVRVLYLSNVEQYVGWRIGRFRPNMLGLPIDERSLVLRTYGFGEARAADHNYRYYVQPAELFQAWLADPKSSNVKRLLRSARPTDVEGFDNLTLSPEAYGTMEQQKRARQKTEKKATPVTRTAGGKGRHEGGADTDSRAPGS